jgi:DNA-binding MarR family transcriptional regulator
MSTRKTLTTTRAVDRVPAGRPTHDLGVLLTLALGAFKERMHAHLSDAGYDDLGPSFGFVFRSLAQQPLSLVELAGRLGMSSQGALKIVSEMIERGYVERRDDADDARVRRLLLTARGEAALREARRFHARIERELVASLGDKWVAAMRVALEAIAGEAAIDATWAAAARPF